MVTCQSCPHNLHVCKNGFCSCKNTCEKYGKFKICGTLNGQPIKFDNVCQLYLNECRYQVQFESFNFGKSCAVETANYKTCNLTCSDNGICLAGQGSQFCHCQRDYQGNNCEIYRGIDNGLQNFDSMEQIHFTVFQMILAVLLSICCTLVLMLQIKNAISYFRNSSTQRLDFLNRNQPPITNFSVANAILPSAVAWTATGHGEVIKPSVQGILKNTASWSKSRSNSKDFTACSSRDDSEGLASRRNWSSKDSFLNKLTLGSINLHAPNHQTKRRGLLRNHSLPDVLSIDGDFKSRAQSNNSFDFSFEKSPTIGEQPRNSKDSRNSILSRTSILSKSFKKFMAERDRPSRKNNGEGSSSLKLPKKSITQTLKEMRIELIEIPRISTDKTLGNHRSSILSSTNTVLGCTDMTTSDSQTPSRSVNSRIPTPKSSRRTAKTKLEVVRSVPATRKDSFSQWRNPSFRTVARQRKAALSVNERLELTHLSSIRAPVDNSSTRLSVASPCRLSANYLHSRRPSRLSVGSNLRHSSSKEGSSHKIEIPLRRQSITISKNNSPNLSRERWKMIRQNLVENKRSEN